MRSPPRRRVALSLIPHQDRVIAAGPVHVINVSPPAGGVVEAPVPEFALNVLLETAPLLRVGFNRPPRWLAVSSGSMIFTPADTACEFIGEAAAHVLAISIPKARVDEFADETGAHVALREEQAFRDPRLMQQMVRLWYELSADTPGRQLLADQVMRTVLDTLATRTGSPARSSARAARERLTTQTLRRLCDYVEQSLDDDLDVTAMAHVAGVSPAHFARAFAATVGMTPFRYVMTRRLARGRELLARTRRSTHAIALDVGFKSPSHFASRFRREFGLAPTEIRSFRTVEADRAG